MDLNPQQLAASKFKTGIASVLAVPGSGKTLTMTNRIANLIKEYQVPPENILALTFTRNAAKSMRDKLKSILNDTSSRVTLSTIHAWAMWLLNEEGKTFDLLHGKEQLRFIRAIMRKHRVVTRPAMILREINLAKNNMISPDDMKAIYPGDFIMEKIAVVYEAYETEKRKKFLMDFNDFLLEARKLLQNPDLREKYQQIYQHILVDEYQDTNPAQMELLKNLVGNNHGSSFYVTGDDWQSIYAFTGASVSNILNFQQIFPGSTQFILDENYRSTPQILGACASLIKHNVKKIEKSLNTHNADGRPVMVIEAANEDDEGAQIINEIKDLVTEYSYRDIAILYRANSQSRVIEEALSKNNIPYHIENGMTFYEKFEVKALLDYLRLIQDPHSPEGDDALKSILNIPNRYISRRFIGELEEFADHQGLYQALKRMPIEVPYLRNNIKDFTRMVDSLIKRRDDIEPADMIEMIRETTEYDKWLSEDDMPSPDNDVIANLDQLQMAAGKYHDIPSLLNYTDSFREQQNRKSDDGVSLMTIHKAKGLEFPIVFVIGFVDGILPNFQGDIEEERRIAFVGISRAMKLLYTSYSTTRMGKAAVISPFLEEILGKKQ